MNQAERTARLDGLLRYFAELAQRTQREPGNELDVTPAIANVFFLGDDVRWTERTVTYLADIGQDRLPHLARLSSIEALHEGEQVLHGGWLWLTGTVPGPDDPITVCFPVFEAPVEVSPNRLGLGYRVRLVGPARVHPAVDATMADVTSILDLGAPSQIDDDRAATALPQLTNRIAALAGVTAVAVSKQSPTRIRNRSGLHLVPGGALYVKRGARPGSRRHDLLQARNLALTGTALETVYNRVPAAQAPVRPVIETMPLTGPQHSAALGGLNRPLTVVSGPPGTGKTHVALATALAAVGHSESVLIATSSRFAADVIAQRFAEVPGLRFFRFGSEDPPALLQAKPQPGQTPPDDDDTSLRQRLATALATEADLGEALQLSRRALTLGVAPNPDLDLRRAQRWLRRANRGFFPEWSRRRAARLLGAGAGTSIEALDELYRFHDAERRIRAVTDPGGVELSTLWDAWEEAVEDRRRRGRAWVAAASAPSGQQQTLAALDTALRAGPLTRRDKLTKLDPGDITSSIPLWIGTLSEVSDYLPFAPAMFDLLIMDEASHTNQLDAVPALVRARRAMVLGDPKQLRHVSFVGDDQMALAAQTVDLPDDLAFKGDVRRNSVFDVAAISAPAVLLNEHHRSAPHIIGFSAERFYDGIRIMTRHPRNEALDVIHTLPLAGRFAGGANEVEANEVEAVIRRLDDGGPGSIGIITPFRKQADVLERRLLDRFSDSDLRRLRLRVGTVHGFQGNQRDTMIISTTVSDHDLTSLRFVDDPHLFNVMVTRAKLTTWLLTSVTEAALPPASLLRAYLRHAEQGPDFHPDRAPQPGWTAELYAALQPFDVRVVADYPVGPFSIDLVVGRGEAALGVETRVDPSGVAAHMERHLALRRAGWRLLDAFQSRWLARPEAAASFIVEHVLRHEEAS